MKVMITGGLGFLGSAIAKSLGEKGVEVYTLSSSTSANANHRSVDIRDMSALTEALSGFDLVIHAAASTDESMPEAELYRINVDGTCNVFDACLRAGSRRIIYISSTGIYGDLDTLPGDEQSPMKAVSPYERTKKEVELLVPEYREKGLDITVVRPSIIYGNHSPMWVGIIKKIEQKKFFIGDGKNRWPIVHVDDVASAVAELAMRPDISNQEFIVADQQAYTYLKLDNLIRKNLGMSGNSKNIPLSVMYFLSRVNLMANRTVGVKYVITPAKIKRFARDREFSIKKINAAIGYTPKINVEQGFADMVNAYRQTAK